MPINNSFLVTWYIENFESFHTTLTASTVLVTWYSPEKADRHRWEMCALKNRLMSMKINNPNIETNQNPITYSLCVSISDKHMTKISIERQHRSRLAHSCSSLKPLSPQSNGMSDEQTGSTSKGQKYSGWWWRPPCPRAAAHEEEEGEWRGGKRWAIGLPCPEQKASGPESMLTAQSATMKGTVARRSGRLTSLAEAPLSLSSDSASSSLRVSGGGGGRATGRNRRLVEGHRTMPSSP